MSVGKLHRRLGRDSKPRPPAYYVLISRPPSLPDGSWRLESYTAAGSAIFWNTTLALHEFKMSLDAKQILNTKTRIHFLQKEKLNVILTLLHCFNTYQMIILARKREQASKLTRNILQLYFPRLDYPVDLSFLSHSSLEIPSAFLKSVKQKKKFVNKKMILINYIMLGDVWSFAWCG